MDKETNRGEMMCESQRLEYSENSAKESIGNWQITIALLLASMLFGWVIFHGASDSSVRSAAREARTGRFVSFVDM